MSVQQKETTEDTLVAVVMVVKMLMMRIQTGSFDWQSADYGARPCSPEVRRLTPRQTRVKEHHFDEKRAGRLSCARWGRRVPRAPVVHDQDGELQRRMQTPESVRALRTMHSDKRLSSRKQFATHSTAHRRGKREPRVTLSKTDRLYTFRCVGNGRDVVAP